MSVNISANQPAKEHLALNFKAQPLTREQRAARDRERLMIELEAKTWARWFSDLTLPARTRARYGKK